MSRGILVTGGAGFIGSHLVDLLLQDGENVTVLDDFSVGSRENLDLATSTGRLKIIDGSIVDAAAVDSAMSGCDRVYHLAVQCVRRSLGRPRESHDVNATGTLVVLEAARRHQVSRVVYCSSSEVYGNASTDRLREDETICKPMTVYGAAKLAGEHYSDAYWRTYGVPTTVVRPFNAYGPRAYQTGMRAEVLPRFVGRVLNGLPPVVFGDGSTGRDFTYVTEVAAGIKRCGELDSLIGERVNIAFGRMVTVAELAEIVLDVLRRNDLNVHTLDARPGDVHQLHASTAKAEHLFGYRAEIAIEDGVRRYIEWVQAQFPDPSVLLETSEINWTMNSESCL